MRESAGRRLAYAIFFALLAGLIVATYNPVQHLKADLHADASGLKLGLEVAANSVERIWPTGS